MAAPASNAVLSTAAGPSLVNVERGGSFWESSLYDIDEVDALPPLPGFERITAYNSTSFTSTAISTTTGTDSMPISIHASLDGLIEGASYSEPFLPSIDDIAASIPVPSVEEITGFHPVSDPRDLGNKNCFAESDPITTYSSITANERDENDSCSEQSLASADNNISFRHFPEVNEITTYSSMSTTNEISAFATLKQTSVYNSPLNPDGTPVYTAFDNLHQIRLLYLYPGSSGEAIKCTTKTVWISCQPQYEALSYMWGPKTLKQIIFNDQVCEVRQNLWDALN